MPRNETAAPCERTASSAVRSNDSIPEHTLRDAAVSYAKAGLRVLPLRPNRKAPYGSLVRHGVKDATTDTAKVEWWWKLKPSANIGIRTGDRLAVIDVDPRNGGRVDPAWPETLTARTAGGGWHLYCRVEEGVKTSHSAIAPGVDVKSDGGYVVAPPSVRGDAGWTWETVMPMATLSASVLQGTPERAAGGEPRSKEAREGRFVPLDVIPEGQRHSELTRWAGWLRGRGYGALEIEEVLSSVNASACVSPLSEDELAGIVRWAGRLPS